MAEIVNLRSRRKALARKAAQVKAAENSVKFGRNKGQKSLESAELSKLENDLDGKKNNDRLSP